MSKGRSLQYHLVTPCLGAITLIFLCCLTNSSEAKSLKDVLVRGSTYTVLGRDTTLAAEAAAPGLATAVSQAVTQQFPFASVSPSLTFRLNPTLNVYERSTTVPGPLFSERALTLGEAGQFNFGVGYSYIDFDELDGTDLDELSSPAYLLFFPNALATPTSAVPLLPGEQQAFYAPEQLSAIRTRITLQAHVIVPSMRYSITDRWDVGLSIPIVNTFLRVRSDRETVAQTDPNQSGAILVVNASGQPTRAIAPVTPTGVRLSRGQELYIRNRSSEVLRQNGKPAKAAGSKTGIGDITLRTKYQLLGDDLGGMALGLNLILPSGDEDDFHGTGETHLSTFVYLSRIFDEWMEPHLNLGIDFNADDVDRSSFLYAVGSTLQVWRNFAVVADFIGRKEFGRIQVDVPASGKFPGFVLDRKPDSCVPENPCQIANPNLADRVVFPFFPADITTNFIADFSFGFRYVIGNKGSVFFGGILPLNNDGFRSDFIPSGGVEYTF